MSDDNVPKLRLKPKLPGDSVGELPAVDSAPAGSPAVPLAVKSAGAAAENSSPLISPPSPDQAAPRLIKKFIFIFAGVLCLCALSYGIYFILLEKTQPLSPPSPVAKRVTPLSPSIVLEATPPAAVVVSAVTLIAPGQAVTPPSAAPVGPPVPSAIFKAWVEGLKINGVSATDRPRILIGGTAYAAGELVNGPLGISFVGYEPATRLLIFKDRTGAIVKHRYH
jgi:hypothetical protein